MTQVLPKPGDKRRVIRKFTAADVEFREVYTAEFNDDGYWHIHHLYVLGRDPNNLTTYHTPEELDAQFLPAPEGR